jgi:hypothetical protein
MGTSWSNRQAQCCSLCMLRHSFNTPQPLYTGRDSRSRFTPVVNPVVIGSSRSRRRSRSRSGSRSRRRNQSRNRRSPQSLAQ